MFRAKSSGDGKLGLVSMKIQVLKLPKTNSLPEHLCQKQMLHKIMRIKNDENYFSFLKNV